MAEKLDRAAERLREGNFVLPSPAEVLEKMHGNGGFTAMQLAEWGISWPPRRGWRRQLKRDWNLAQRQSGGAA